MKTKTSREIAMAWWNDLKYPSVKETICDKYHSFRHWMTLTGREIEEMYNKEKNNEAQK